MLQFKQEDTSAVLIVTLTEKVTISDPYYLFVFVHVLTKAVISFVKYIGQDESNFQSRYNQFTINPAIVFASAPIGEWHYTVYEQVSSSNTDPSQAGNELEYGKLLIDRTTAYAPTMYNQPQTYSAYNA